jgi:hypothetical protein
MPCVLAALVLVGYLLARRFGRVRGARSVPVVALLVMFSGPANSGAGQLHAAPTGLLAVIGSFLLFGLGTLAALTKQHWNRTDPR